ncbi:MAG: hypothetical protein WC932_03675 [archaeon]|jgi:hypothetical protein
MAKENNKKLIIWALVALVVGVVIGLLLTSIVTTGNAATALGEKSATLDTKTTEDNVVESRTNLVLNLLKVNRIENRDEDLLIHANSGTERLMLWGDTMTNIWAPSIDISGSTAVAISTPVNFIGLGTDGINIFAHNFMIANSEQTQTNPIISLDLENSELVINASTTKFINVVSVSPIISEYSVGDTFTIENNTIEVAAIWDANGVVEMHLFDANMINPIVEFYGEGDIIFNQYLTASLKVENISQNVVGIVVLPTGNSYYACIGSDGTLFKSNYPCN